MTLQSTTPTTVAGITRIEHTMQLPLNWNDQQGATTQVFAREIYAAGQNREKLPMLLFLQGGPGGASPRPRAKTGWIGEALKRYRVILLDQRGVARSEQIDVAAPWETNPQKLADRLSLYRADSIINDAEAFRVALGGEDAQFALLGQSYGGFLSLRYLSVNPDALERVLITGGVPSVERPATDVYRETFRLLGRKTKRFFTRFPAAVEQYRALEEVVAAGGVQLLDGRTLSVTQLRFIGFALGSDDGDFATAELLETAFVAGTRVVSTAFKLHMQQILAFASPIFAVLHESIYAQGEATNWAAKRVMDEVLASGGFGEDVPFLTGEMILPEFFTEIPTLQPFAETAEILAQKSDWPMLYDVAQLERNTVPLAAAVYADDIFVPLNYSLETLDRMPNTSHWITNTYEHSGLRTGGDRIFNKLFEMTLG